MQGLGHNAVCWATGTQQSFELVPRPLSTILLCGQPDYVYACNNNRTWVCARGGESLATATDNT